MENYEFARGPHVPLPASVQPMRADGSVLRTVFLMLRNPLASWPVRVYEDTSYFPGIPGYILIMDPDVIAAVLLERAGDFPHGELFKRILQPLWGKGLITSQGSEWRWQRQAVAPIFRPAKIAGLAPVIEKATKAAVMRWRAQNDIEAVECCADLALDLLVETILGGAEEFKTGAARAEITYVIGEISRHRLSFLLPDALQRWMPRIARRESASLKRRIERLIAQRREAAPRGDLIDQLLAAKDPETGKGMDTALLADNLLGFLAAGHDTVSVGLMWSLYIMAIYPDVARRLRQEALTSVGEGAIGAGAVQQLHFTRAVIQEVLRLFPPAPILVRQAQSPLSAKGIDIRKGNRVVIPVYVIHRHRALWTNPDAFDPSRFAPSQPPPGRYAYLPFGAGQRICVGASLAMIELTVAMATIARLLAPALIGAREIEPVAGIALKPRGGMRMRLSFHER